MRKQERPAMRPEQISAHWRATRASAAATFGWTALALGLPALIVAALPMLLGAATSPSLAFAVILAAPLALAGAAFRRSKALDATDETHAADED